jgi:chemotaxis signal transduction protein
MSEGWRAGRVAEIRRAFDESFARLPERADDELEDLLSIRVGGDPFALPLAEIAGVHPRRSITPLPGGAPALLGLAGIRGRLVAVHDLARVLGYEAAKAQRRWIVVCRADERLALALDEVEGHARVSRERLTTVERAGHVVKTFEDGSIVRAVLGVPALLSGLRRKPVQEGR